MDKEILGKLAEELEKAERKAEAEKHAEKIAIAKKMLSDGLNAELVAKYSGLSIEDIRKFQ